MDVNAILLKTMEQGPLGVLLAIVLYMVYKLYQKLNEVQEKRIAEGLSCQTTMQANTQAVKDLTTAIRGRDGGI